MPLCPHQIPIAKCGTCMHRKPRVRRVPIPITKPCAQVRRPQVRAATLAAFGAKWGWMFVKRGEVSK